MMIFVILKADFIMTIYSFSAISIFYSRIFLKKLDDSARILFWNVEFFLKCSIILTANHSINRETKERSVSE